VLVEVVEDDGVSVSVVAIMTSEVASIVGLSATVVVSI
jgi:hypothetical protein